MGRWIQMSVVAFFGFLFFAGSALAGGDGGQPLAVPWWSALPFALLLGSIAVLPLVAEHWWHANRNKAIITLLCAIPTALYLFSIQGATNGESTSRLYHELGEYVAFVTLLLALYTIAGGIVVTGDIPARPITNTGILAFGAVLANFIGTTGASMILIRPLLRINAERDRKAHLPVFFIFVVSNTGGLLTPLGDPPLFLGFLKGVDFFWTLKLWPQWLIVNLSVLAIFYVWDNLAYRKETKLAIKLDEFVREPIRVRGLAVNAPLIMLVIACVLLQSPSVGASLGRAFGFGDLTLKRPIGECLFVTLSVLSLLLTPRGLRTQNAFSWGPILEVAILFVGIFVCMVPALALLEVHGPKLGISQPWQYFWLTGLLSSFLDNAPTYVTFGTLASSGHDFAWLAQEQPRILGAISCGAVFMGAMTYIGNGPNFMVKAIAEHSDYPMPSFLGYMAYSFGILFPLFVILTLILT